MFGAILIGIIVIVIPIMVLGKFVIGPLQRWSKRREIAAGLRTTAQIDQATAIADGIARARAQEAAEYRKNFPYDR